MPKIEELPAYKRYLNSNPSELGIKNLTADENGVYHLYPGERFCRVTDCPVDDIFTSRNNLRKHFKKRHEAIYNAFDNAAKRGGAQSLEVRARAARWYNKIIEDYDARKPATVNPNEDSSLETDSNRIRSVQSVTPMKRRFSSSSNIGTQSPLNEMADTMNCDSIADNPHNRASTHREQEWNSSSTMSLVTGAFQIHNSNTPDTSMTTALPGGRINIGDKGTVSPQNRNLHGPQPPVGELVSALPSFEVASLLVDTYFDRAHWFILVFHQEDFRAKWQWLYRNLAEKPAESNFNIDFISTLLMVMVIGLQYTGPHRRHLLAAHNVDATTLKDSMLALVRARMIDIVALGSLEAAQTCILLGTYYLYHGDPGLAWPICGCGLRIAQALNLHRRIDIAASRLASMSLDMRRQYETRKRCWWAIYEIEAFCSMSYGFPQAIRDTDCNVDLPDPIPIGQLPASTNTRREDHVSLLSYKHLMSKLSILTKVILTEIYGANLSGSHGQGQLCEVAGCASTMHHLAHITSSLESKLQEWKEEIPPQLCLNPPEATSINYTSVEEMDQDIGASGPKFNNYIYQLQALALEIAYENAKLLVHRPLLQYKQIPRAGIAQTNPTGPLYQTLDHCRDAAVNISEIGSTSIFSLAADTYAAAFIGIHTFTAGVTLCILASIEPLTLHSHKSKMGLHQLLGMQRKLAPKSQLAAQGLGILERLTKLVMEKELKQMLAQNDISTASKGKSLDSHAADTDQTRGSEAIDGSLDDFSNFEFWEDPTISQALSDFDMAISGRMPPETGTVADDLERQLFPETWGTTDRFAQQQAWIWSGDYLAHFPGFAEE